MNEKKMRKGGVSAVLLVLIIGVVTLVVEGVFIQNFVADIDTVRRSVREATITEIINSVEFFKKALQESLELSFYQASYDVAKKGGYHQFANELCLNQIPYWRSYSNKYRPPPTEASLSSATLELFNCYKNDYADSYSSLNIQFNAPNYVSCGGISLRGTTSNMHVSIFEDKDKCTETGLGSSGELYNIRERNADFIESSIDTNVLRLFEVGKEWFLDKEPDPIYEAVIYGTEHTRCKNLHYYPECNKCEIPDPDNLLQSKCSNWEGELERAIEEGLNSLAQDMENEEGISARFEVEDLNGRYEGSCGGCHAYDKCNCKTSCAPVSQPEEQPKEVQTKIVHKSLHFADTTNEDTEGEEEPTCDETNCPPPSYCSDSQCCRVICDIQYRVTCTYDYWADVRVRVELFDTSDESNYYPIYNDWRYLTLQFYVQTGNLGETKPATGGCAIQPYC